MEHNNNSNKMDDKEERRKMAAAIRRVSTNSLDYPHKNVSWFEADVVVCCVRVYIVRSSFVFRTFL